MPKIPPLIWLIFAPFGYLLACALVSATLAYPLHYLLPKSFDYNSFVFRIAQLVLIIGLFPIGKKFGVTQKDLGLVPSLAKILPQILKGISYGVLMLGLHVVILYGLNVRGLNGDKLQILQIFWMLVKGVGIGLMVAMIEEPLFRGFFFGLISKQTSSFIAVLVSSIYFSGLHFLQSDIHPDYAGIEWDTGYRMVLDAFFGFASMHTDSFLALLAAGLLLTSVRLLSLPNNLGYCIGIHAGWIAVIKTSLAVTSPKLITPWIFLISAFDGIIGNLSALWSAFFALGLAYWVNRNQVKKFSLTSIQSIQSIVVISVFLKLWFSVPTELLPHEALIWGGGNQGLADIAYGLPAVINRITALAIGFFGENEFGLRAYSQLLWPVSVWLYYRVGQLWFDEAAARRGVVIFIFMPILWFSSFWASSESMIILLWLISLYALSLALKTNRLSYWIVGGFSLAMLLSITSIAWGLIAGLVVFMSNTHDYRIIFKSLGFWLALGITILLGSLLGMPHNSVSDQNLITQQTLALTGSWLDMALLVSPLFFLYLVYALLQSLRMGLREKNSGEFLMLCITLCSLLAFIAGQSQSWWSLAPVFVSMTLPAANFYPYLKQILNNIGYGLAENLNRLAFVFAIVTILGIHTGLALNWPKSVAGAQVGAWKWSSFIIKNAAQLIAKPEGLPPAIVVVGTDIEAAMLSFYLPGQFTKALNNEWKDNPDQRRSLAKPKFLAGQPVVFALPQKNSTTVAAVVSHCAEPNPVLTLDIQGLGDFMRQVNWSVCQQFIWPSSVQ